MSEWCIGFYAVSAIFQPYNGGEGAMYVAINIHGEKYIHFEFEPKKSNIYILKNIKKEQKHVYMKISCLPA